MNTILVVEDDQRIQKSLSRLFQAEGYRVEIAKDGTLGLAAFRASCPAAVVLDLKLPGISGRDICREIKDARPSLPVVILSAVTDVADKVLLLELGADDYVTKPFSPRELLARVQAAIRRVATKKNVEDSTIRFGDTSVDFARMQLTRSGEPIALTTQEFKLLRFFVSNPERVIGREELLNKVWDYKNYPSTRTVDNQILKLRQKLEKNPGNPVHFLTVHGAGYKFVP
ncbi:MAG TPA: response regulator transcription factor [Terriglobales bacterium]|jgi:DNA-binding response OmpR family regulator|nr:response regulator transcription factor [Terriglobales bacterium]